MPTLNQEASEGVRAVLAAAAAGASIDAPVRELFSILRDAPEVVQDRRLDELGRGLQRLGWDEPRLNNLDEQWVATAYHG